MVLHLCGSGSTLRSGATAALPAPPLTCSGPPLGRWQAAEPAATCQGCWEWHGEGFEGFRVGPAANRNWTQSEQEGVWAKGLGRRGSPSYWASCSSFDSSVGNVAFADPFWSPLPAPPPDRCHTPPAPHPPPPAAPSWWGQTPPPPLRPRRTPPAAGPEDSCSGNRQEELDDNQEPLNASRWPQLLPPSSQTLTAAS